MNKYFLTEDQLMIQELAKKFADEVVAATVTELDEKHEFPMAEVKQCAEMGFLGVCVPEEYGGAGLDHLSDVLVMEQLARHSSSLASIIDAHASLGSLPILMAGAGGQEKEKVAPAGTGGTLFRLSQPVPQSRSDAAPDLSPLNLDRCRPEHHELSRVGVVHI